jgi:hypothetical protein
MRSIVPKKILVVKLIFTKLALMLVNLPIFNGENIMSFRSLFSMFAVLIVSAALILGLAVNPTMAGSSSLSKGIEQLPKIDDAAAQVAERSAPMGLKEIEARSKNGLNEIQGAADVEKMHKADTSKPGAAIANKIDKAISKATK